MTTTSQRPPFLFVRRFSLCLLLKNVRCPFPPPYRPPFWTRLGALTRPIIPNGFAIPFFITYVFSDAVRQVSY